MLQLAQVKLGAAGEGLCYQLANFEEYEGLSRHTGKKVQVQISPALRLTTGQLLG